MNMTQGRQARNERVLVIAATALGVVAVFGVINATAGVIGRDAVRPVGPKPVAVHAARHGRPEVLYAIGPKLPPPLPGTRPATAPPLPPLEAALYQPPSGIDVYVEKPPPAARAEPTPDTAIRYAAPQRLRAPREEAASSTPPPMQPSGAREPDVAAANAAAMQNGPPETTATPPASANQNPNPNPAPAAAAPAAPPPPAAAPREQVATAAAAAREPVVEDARVLRTVEPVFPDDIRSSLPGTVSATVVISLGPSGSVLGTRIERSTGYRVLDQAAQEAARESRYSAARIDGKPAASTFRAVYDFSP